MQACNEIGMIGMQHPIASQWHINDWSHWDAIIPMTGSIGMSIGMIIPRDGGWLPRWDEALDEPIRIIEAVYFAI